ncbi:MAG: HlyD family efflux transporter periplasmic adaptor subunit [Polyangiaceae bacterium]
MLFARTLYLLSSERARGNAIALGLVGVLLGAWGIWLATGRVTVQTVARNARFEAEDPPLAIQPDVDGLVEWSDLRLGREVKAGDLLVKLDTTRMETQRNRQLTLIAGLEGRMIGLQGELDAELKARDAQKGQVGVSASVSAANADVAKTVAEYKRREAEMAKKLAEGGLADGQSRLSAEAERDRALKQEIAVLREGNAATSNARMSLLERETRIAAMGDIKAERLSQLENAKSDLKVLEAEIARYQIRAAISGRLAEISPISTGQRLPAGTRIATIVPPTKLRVVANFAPEEAIGRVKPGQHVVLRVDNYSWAQYGTVDAVVDQVANETRDGLVRAEMHISKENPEIPLVHGLTTQAEVDVERVSPLGLLLRMAGQNTPRTATPAGGSSTAPPSGLVPAR